MWYLYIIEKREKFYTGITTDLNNRLHQHGNSPLLYKETFQNKHQAARRFLSFWAQRSEAKNLNFFSLQIYLGVAFSKEKKQNLINGLIKWVYTELSA